MGCNYLSLSLMCNTSHELCTQFALYCVFLVGGLWSILLISFRVTWLPLGQPYDCSQCIKFWELARPNFIVDNFQTWKRRTAWWHGSFLPARDLGWTVNVCKDGGCPSNSEAALKSFGKLITWSQYYWWNHNKAKQSRIMCIFYRTYSVTPLLMLWGDICG